MRPWSFRYRLVVPFLFTAITASALYIFLSFLPALLDPLSSYGASQDDLRHMSLLRERPLPSLFTLGAAEAELFLLERAISAGDEIDTIDVLMPKPRCPVLANSNLQSFRVKTPADFCAAFQRGFCVLRESFFHEPRKVRFSNYHNRTMSAEEARRRKDLFNIPPYLCLLKRKKYRRGPSSISRDSNSIGATTTEIKEDTFETASDSDNSALRIGVCGGVSGDGGSLENGGCNPFESTLFGGACEPPSTLERLYHLVAARRPHYARVLTISTRWGSAYYHFTADVLVRLVPAYDLLLRHPDIRVHITHDSVGLQLRPYVVQGLKFFGVHPSRLVFGELTADLVLYPQPTMCSRTSVSQLLNLRALIHHILTLRRQLKDNNPQQDAIQLQQSQSQPLKEQILVVDRAGSSRALNNHADLVRRLRDLFPDFVVAEYRSSPDYAATMETFARSSVVVAPHGAGLVHIVAMPAESVVVELMGSLNDCFRSMAINLGHIYRSWNGDRGAAIGAPMAGNLDEILAIVDEAVRERRRARRSNS
jgi:hypothetical protein